MKKEEKEKELSPDEIKARKGIMMSFYEEQLPFIEIQEKYERLIASIAESRTKKLMMEMKFAELIGQAANENKK